MPAATGAMITGVLSGRRLLNLLPEKLARGAAWNGLAQIMYRGLVVLGMLIAARILGRESFGQLSVLYTTTMTFHVVASLGLIMTGTKLVAELHQRDKARTGRIIALCHYVALASGGLVGLGMLAGAPWIAAEILNSPDLAGGVRLTALLLLVQVLADSTLGINLGFLAFRGLFVANALSGICSFGFLVAGAGVYGVFGALAGLAAAETVRFFLLLLLSRRSARRHGIPHHWRFPWDEMPVIWQVSLPSMATALLWLPVTWIGALMLVRQPGGYGEMGLYGAANQWFSLLLFVPGVVTQTILPILSAQVAGGGRGEAKDLALKSAGIMLGLVTLIALPLALGSPLIAAAYGNEFTGGTWVFVLMFLAAVAGAPQGILGNFLAARNQFWLRFRLNVLWAVCYLIAAYDLVDHGAAGLAVSMVVAYTIRSLATFACVVFGRPPSKPRG